VLKDLLVRLRLAVDRAARQGDQGARRQAPKRFAEQGLSSKNFMRNRLGVVKQTSSMDRGQEKGFAAVRSRQMFLGAKRQ
jgi:hypothetical protein